MNGFSISVWACVGMVLSGITAGFFLTVYCFKQMTKLRGPITKLDLELGKVDQDLDEKRNN